MEEENKTGDWIKSIVVGVVGAAVVLFALMMLFFGGKGSPTPEKDKLRNAYNACMTEANHPSKTQADKDVILKGMCQGLRERFVRDYREEP